MTKPSGDAHAILEQYANTLLASCQAATEGERDRASDDLLEITGTVEQHGEEIGRLLLQMLSDHPRNGA